MQLSKHFMTISKSNPDGSGSGGPQGCLTSLRVWAGVVLTLKGRDAQLSAILERGFVQGQDTPGVEHKRGGGENRVLFPRGIILKCGTPGMSG